MQITIELATDYVREYFAECGEEVKITDAQRQTEDEFEMVVVDFEYTAKFADGEERQTARFTVWIEEGENHEYVYGEW